jgi:ribonuclease R
MYRQIPQRFHTKLKALPEEGAEPTGDEIVNSFLAIKSFAVASYEVDKSGHFGLGLSTYTHFTSPIRRYFDVVLHRILAGYVFEEDGMREMLAWLNHRERLVDQLQGLYNDWKLIAGGGMAVGDTWDITVTRVMRAGVYYLYTPLMMDGFMHVSTLSPGGVVRWVLDSERGRLVSQCGAHELAVGSVLRCTVASIDTMKCTFALRVL